MKTNIDVLCAGHACYDLVFGVDHHPEADEKTFASQLFSCGGGPAANAAVAAARLGYRSAFAGYLGDDFYGRTHLQEFADNGVMTDLVVRGAAATPLSAILVKPDGKRTVINYKRDIQPLVPGSVDFSNCKPKVVLFDGHEPLLSLALMEDVKNWHALTVLDAGSVHSGTRELVGLVDYVVASQKFAHDFTGISDIPRAAAELHRIAKSVVVTCGENDLVWETDEGTGDLPAFAVKAVDTTGAGDAFHGAFAAGVAAGMKWPDLLRYSSAVGALCCTKHGARPAIPTAGEVKQFLDTQNI